MGLLAQVAGRRITGCKVSGTPWLVVLAVLCLAAAVAAALAWRAASARADRAEMDAAAERERHAAAREEHRAKVADLDRALAHERALLRRIRESWRAEREWARELRHQLNEAHQAQQRLNQGTGSVVSVQEHILEAAVQLVDAKRGLLLARADEDGDGDLDLVASRGFDSSPEHSPVAQRFARQVLERDEIIREDDPGEDPEIHSLVAIPLYLRDRFSGVIVCADREGGFTEVGDEMLLALGDHAGASLQHERLNHEIRESQRNTVRALAEAVAGHDPVLHRESGWLAILAGRLAQAIGLDDRSADVLVCATVLRALGYLTIPERALFKAGPLTPEERDVVQMHPRSAFNVLAQVPELRDVAVTLLYHHERFDGNGYPAGLAGEAIPVTARALAVLETFAALTHERPYRASMTTEDAVDVLLRHAGTQLDPDIVITFSAMLDSADIEPSDALVETMLDVLPFEPGHEDFGVTRLTASAVDGLTLLGNHRALLEDVDERARPTGRRAPFAVVLAELTELGRVNEELGYVAGDRMLLVAARAARRAAARLGGTAYRASGRRMAVVAPLSADCPLERVVDEVRTEFAIGPTTRVAASPWDLSEPGEDLVVRAREALRTG